MCDKLIKNIDYKSISTNAYILIEDYDKNNNIIINNNSKFNNKILNGKLVNFNIELKNILEKINNIFEYKIIKNENNNENNNKKYKIDEIFVSTHNNGIIKAYIIL
jgi:hypothetical protein